ncbi:FIST N-terminal domain-containing protein [Actinoplanes sp. TBRC 11911]|uniref:FIST signal transduction protein n=1 Tax=Actinoplanes sp. TBRC 11911 TaxID=2729386 RepID=UPI0028A015B1|nr:FIST N-terminal domain-containing protein [Actinoplanes sp. TBRC 11911]
MPDSAKAGAEAAAEAIGGRTPKAVFVFCSVAHDLPVLLAAVRAEAGRDAVIVGTTTIGELAGDGAGDGGVVISALGGDGFTVQARAAHVDPHDPRAAGAAAASALHGMHDDNRVLILLCDGLAPRPHEIVRGASSSVGATIPLVGGLSGDDRQFAETFQFYGDEVLTGSVVGVALGSDGPIGVGVAHGWSRVEPPMTVTRGEGTHIYELDGEPALDVLRRRFDGRLPPLGLPRRGGADIRVIHAGSDEERSVWGTADLPQGAVVWPMEADRPALLAGASSSCMEAVSQLDGLPPLGAILFDCGGRRAGLAKDGGDLDDEIAVIREALDDAPFVGLYTLGEIARVRGALGMHALTLVTLALA